MKERNIKCLQMFPTSQWSDANTVSSSALMSSSRSQRFLNVLITNNGFDVSLNSFQTPLCCFVS